MQTQPKVEGSHASPYHFPCRVRTIAADGTVFIEWAEAPGGEIAAHVSSLVSPVELRRAAGRGERVLVAWSDRDFPPVIVGLVLDRLPRSEPKVERLHLEARSEITLICGSSRVRLTPERVIVESDNVKSRARQTHKIRGGTVSIN